MELLIEPGMPQRSAHHLIGQLVRRATEKGVSLSELSLSEYQSFDSTLDDSIYDLLGTGSAVAAFQSLGSTGPEQVNSKSPGGRFTSKGDDERPKVIKAEQYQHSR